MLLLDRAAHIDLVPLFYESISLNSVSQLNQFTKTVQSNQTLAWRAPPWEYVYRFAISVPYVYCVPTPDPVLLADTLCAFPNLELLHIDIPVGDVELLLWRAISQRAPFRLRRLHSTYIGPMIGFLRQQDSIEEFHDISDIKRMYKENFTIEAGKDLFLPKLKTLKGIWDHVCLLVPGRPISRLELYNRHERAFENMFKFTSQASAPLSEFKVVQDTSHVSDVGRCILSWMQGLSYACKSLEKLEFQFECSSRHELKLFVSIAAIDTNLLFEVLSQFSALRVLTFGKVGAKNIIWPPETSYIESSLKSFSFWKNICPSLRFVSFFGDVLAEE
ncbi:hypothetical protein RhiJN_23396 [Ceratobasidium sp. AG-Ba]|nr:hypothetical protein RhiJN_23396 [Ceratobasidium sp. AG-Ba]